MTQASTRRIFLGGSAALLSLLPTLLRAQDVLGGTAVTGAGSTFAYPMLSKWAQGYQRWVAGGGHFPAGNSGLDDSPTGPVLDYEPSGSLAGIMRVKEGAVDFGASDAPLKTGELAKLKLGQFPIVIGGIAAVVNIDGVAPGQLKLSGPVLADIFLGKVDRWSHAEIRALNPDVKLPDAKINVVRRADGSGTTYNFTHYLAAVSPEWKDKVGSDLLVPWPVGAAAKGNDGISQTVRQVKNAIGYVEFAHALKTRLSYASIQNAAGKFVTPAPAAFQAAAANADWDKSSDFDLLLSNAPGENAYPIVATVFVLMHKNMSSRRARSAFNLFEWVLDKGAGDAVQLGYVPLPQTLVAQVKTYWARNYQVGS
jgi:phosphate transport system substrate-binding protein